MVLVATVRALKHHGGADAEADGGGADGMKAIESGMANLHRHLGIVSEFGVPAVVAVNRRPEDTDEEVELVRRLATEGGAFAAAVSSGFAEGGKGVAELAEAVVAAAEEPNQFHFLYEDGESIKEKIETIAERVYGASEVVYYLEAEKKIAQFTRAGPGRAPGLHGEDAALALRRSRSCSARQPAFQLPVRDVRAYTGAGWLVPLCGAIQQMPGLGRDPGRLRRRRGRRGSHGRAVLSGVRPCREHRRRAAGRACLDR